MYFIENTFGGTEMFYGWLLCKSTVLETSVLFWRGLVCFGFFARCEREEKMFHILQADSISGEVTVEICVSFQSCSL